MFHSGIEKYKKELVLMSMGYLLSFSAWLIRYFFFLEVNSFIYLVLTIIIYMSTIIGLIGGVIFFAKFMKESFS